MGPAHSCRSRTSLLTHSASAIVYPVTVGVRVTARERRRLVSQERPLRLGLAGMGVGASQLLPAMTTGAHVRLAAVGDLRQDALDRAAAEYGVETYRSVEGLCRSP